MATSRKSIHVDAPASEDGESTGTRSFWSGTLSFGLVTVPVELYAAQRTTRASLRMLSPEGTPLARRYYREGADEPLEREQIERGYELDDGRMIPVTSEELSALLPEQSRDIDLKRFVEADAIDPRYFDRAYFLAPSGKSSTAYRLLAQVMERTKKVGLATFVMRGKQYVVAIAAEHGLLRAETLRFEDELRTPKDVGLPKVKEPRPADVKRMRAAIKRLSKKDFVLKELEDESQVELQKLVEKKKKAGKGIVEAPEVDEREGEVGADVIDLVAVLRESLQKKGATKAPAKRKARRAS